MRLNVLFNGSDSVEHVQFINYHFYVERWRSKISNRLYKCLNKYFSNVMKNNNYDKILIQNLLQIVLQWRQCTNKRFLKYHVFIYTNIALWSLILRCMLHVDNRWTNQWQLSLSLSAYLQQCFLASTSSVSEQMHQITLDFSKLTFTTSF